MPIKELEEEGVFFDELAEAVGRDYDAFDLLCDVAHDQQPLTRRERANNVKKQDYFAKYGEQARAVLEALLDKYANQGLEAIEKLDVCGSIRSMRWARQSKLSACLEGRRTTSPR